MAALSSGGDSGSGTSAAAAVTKLRDEALAAAKALEVEAASLRDSNQAHSAQLKEEADLLKSAAAAQERVRAAAAALDLEREQADLLEQQAAALRARLHPEHHRDDDSEGDADSIATETAAVAHLHSQAAAVQNIKNLIPIVLDLQASNYSKWRGFILLILGRFALKDHVLSDAIHLHDAAWSRMDCVVVSWIFNTIAPDLLDVVHERDGITARAAWLGLEQQFFNNRESRAMLLDAEFRTLCQGTLSVDEYCRKMKHMADALADLGKPVLDRTLVLNVLRSLNERFQFMSQLVTRQKPFPSFADVCADLRLAELNMASPSAPPSALVTAPSSKPPAPSPAPQRPPQPAGGQQLGHTPSPSRHPQAAGGQQSGNGNNRGRRRRGGRGHGGAQAGTQAGPPNGQQWPSFFNPWTGSIQMWPGSNPGGSRGPPPQQALMAGVPPGYFAPPPVPGAYYQAPQQAPTSPSP